MTNETGSSTPDIGFNENIHANAKIWMWREKKNKQTESITAELAHSNLYVTPPN